MTMEKTYSQAPLPFVGQKRMFASEFRKVLKRFSDKTVFIDLFGGSGLLSHITKRERPDATVIYNDPTTTIVNVWGIFIVPMNCWRTCVRQPKVIPGIKRLQAVCAIRF